MKNTAIKAACIGLLASPLLLATQPASAGSNGQQINVNAGWFTNADVKVQGTNQANNFVTWTGKTNWAGGNASTNNSWWKGNVTVTVTKRSSTWTGDKTVVCSANVPKSQLGDWYTIDCKP